jgi:hypothetical protein
MKLWYGYGSEHSMNLVMIGRFKDATSAARAKQVIDRFKHRIVAEVQAGLLTVGGAEARFSDDMLDFLRQVKIYSLGPAELEQFAYDVTVEVKGDQVAVRTDEYDVSAFLKVLLDNGARIEVYSAHDYPETRGNRDE